MENRKTVSVKLEVYEDKVGEFKSLLWKMKRSLSDDGIERIRENYIDPTIFDQNYRPYFDFMRYIVDMVKIQSLEDEEDKVPPIDIFPVAEGVGCGKELEDNFPVGSHHPLEDPMNTGDDEKIEVYGGELLEMIGEGDGSTTEVKPGDSALEEDILYFISMSRDLRKKLSEKRKFELVRYIKHHVAVRGIRNYRKDGFWEAALCTQLNQKVIPSDLKHLLLLDDMFDFRYSPNVVFQDNPLFSPRRMTKTEIYGLANDLFQHTRFWFSDLADPGSNDYQLRIITGFILSKIGLLESDEAYQGGKDWRVYLAERVMNWLREYGNGSDNRS